MSWQGAWKDERGFTLVEVLLVIILMGIVLAIASSSFFGAVESRQVDSGTNRLAADLRNAHSKAINRLAPQTVTVTAASSKYTMTGVADPVDLDDSPDVGDDVIVANNSVAVAFCPNGAAAVAIPPSTPSCSTALSGASTTITVRSSSDTTNNHDIQINLITSRVRVVP